MQERVAETHGEKAEPSWYLTRDGKQFGPLTDRELSLFAEGGNFKTGDLLWTEGLDSWKPADAIFSLGPSAKDVIQAPSEPSGEAVDALVQALTAATEVPKPTLKERAVAEIKTFAAIFVYLWVVLIVLLLHEWIVLSENHIGFKFYGLAAINALVLGKIMLVAEHFRFAEQLKEKPLIYPIVYKSVAFTTLLFIAYILEEMLVGWFRGAGFFASMPTLGGGIVSALSFWVIFCIALVPFFAFREIERALGSAKFRAMLFGRGRLTP